MPSADREDTLPTEVPSHTVDSQLIYHGPIPGYSFIKKMDLSPEACSCSQTFYILLYISLVFSVTIISVSKYRKVTNLETFYQDLHIHPCASLTCPDLTVLACLLLVC